ncbi:hypothetical protein [Streptomyces sp. NPDC127112]|uniref:hypothetical protein n=1 Tax=Streptomyces sp. NPDC127112 TaxID=3345364 RepID=UPI0036448CD9
MDHVNFVNSRQYPASTFRRWFGEQQDRVMGFGSAEAFKVEAIQGGAVTVAAGSAFVLDASPDEKVKGLYQLVQDEPVSETLAGSEHLWVFPLDTAEHPAEGDPNGKNVQFIKTESATPPFARALLLCAMENGKLVDKRFTGEQFVVTRSGPGRYGAPGSSEVPYSALARMSLGTQYTDLREGTRYVRKGMAGSATDWFRDRGEVGPEGPVGPQGAKGDKGDQGPAGGGIDPNGKLTANGLELIPKAPLKGDASIAGTLKVGAVDDVAAAITANTTAVGKKVDTSTFTAEVGRLDKRIDDLAGKVSPGGLARTSGVPGGTGQLTVPWNYSGNKPLNGFTSQNGSTELRCDLAGRYAIGVGLHVSYASSSTSKLAIHVNNRDVFNASIATTGGRPSGSVLVSLAKGDVVKVLFDRAERMSVEDDSFISLSVTA